MRIPRAFLQDSTSTEVFDVYERILVKDPRTGDFNQFERLARPVINKGLFVTNDFLNAFNTIGPSRDLSAAAAPVRTEAAKTLAALGNSPNRINTLVGAFLPDVMRIDTTVPSGYLNATNAQASPIAGRMLSDDVVDMTLQVLTNNPAATDNLSYEGEPGNPAQGHTPLEPNFPYLALPN